MSDVFFVDLQHQQGVLTIETDTHHSVTQLQFHVLQQPPPPFTSSTSNISNTPLLLKKMVMPHDEAPRSPIIAIHIFQTTSLQSVQESKVMASPDDDPPRPPH